MYEDTDCGIDYCPECGELEFYSGECYYCGYTLWYIDDDACEEDEDA